MRLKLRLLVALLGALAVGAVVYVRASVFGGDASSTPASASASSGESCCGGPSPESVLPNPYAAKPSVPAKN
jgi:uncharacterized membrane protein